MTKEQFPVTVYLRGLAIVHASSKEEAEGTLREFAATEPDIYLDDNGAGFVSQMAEFDEINLDPMASLLPPSSGINLDEGIRLFEAASENWQVEHCRCGSPHCKRAGTKNGVFYTGSGYEPEDMALLQWLVQNGRTFDREGEIMSRVHNYIIIPDILENSHFITLVNRYLTDETGKSNMFAPIEDYAGGGKAFEAKLWAMAANYEPTPEQVIQALLQAEPKYPENLQFLFQTEDDERFTMLTGDQIKPDAAPF